MGMRFSLFGIFRLSVDFLAQVPIIQWPVSTVSVDQFAKAPEFTAVSGQPLTRIQNFWMISSNLDVTNMCQKKRVGMSFFVAS